MRKVFYFNLLLVIFQKPVPTFAAHNITKASKSFKEDSQNVTSVQSHKKNKGMFAGVHLRSLAEVQSFSYFEPHPECNNSKTTPDNEWGPYYHDHLHDANTSALAKTALKSLDKSMYPKLQQNCPIANKTFVYYYDSFVDPGALLFVYSCNFNEKVTTHRTLPWFLIFISNVHNLTFR